MVQIMNVEKTLMIILLKSIDTRVLLALEFGWKPHGHNETRKIKVIKD